MEVLSLPERARCASTAELRPEQARQTGALAERPLQLASLACVRTLANVQQLQGIRLDVLNHMD